MRPHRWTDIAIVFQGAMNALNPVRTIGSQIVEAIELHGRAKRAAARLQTGELLESVGIPAARAGRFPHELSGGMRQRAAIAMALSCKPKVLIADEPTTALDVMVQAQILELLDALCRDFGLALILVTHDLPVVAQLCDHGAVMYAGEIVERGLVDTLYHAPRHPYTRLLFAATPDLGQETEEIVSIPGAPPRLDQPLVGCPFRPTLRQRVRTVHDLATAPARGRGSSRRSVPPQRPRLRGAAMTVRETPLLDVDDLYVRYPVPRGLVGLLRRRPQLAVHAVDGVTLVVQAGELVALVGESGCGKTTTAQAVLRLVDPASGSVRFQGDDITELGMRALRPVRRRMQIVYQDPYESLDPRLRVQATVEEPLLIHGIGSKTERASRVRDALARAGLSPPELYLERFPHQLSGGQRQRVAIAAALVLDPQLLVADEPVSMLDVSVRAGVLRLLEELKAGGLGILMITHDLSTAARFADRIAVMYLGRIVEEGPAGEVVRNPQHPYTKALLSVVPRRDPRMRRRPQILRGETPDAVRIPSGCRFHPRCPIAIEACRAEDPSLRRPAGAQSPHHRVACLLA